MPLLGVPIAIGMVAYFNYIEDRYGEAARQRARADYFQERYLEERSLGEGVIQIRPGESYMLTDKDPAELPCRIVEVYNNDEELVPVNGGGC